MQILPRGLQLLHTHRQTYRHDESNRHYFFHYLTYSTYSLKMRRVTVAPDHKQWHTPYSVALLWASDRPVAETKLVVAVHNPANSLKSHHFSRSAACIICHHVVRRPPIAIWGYGLQMCRLSANIYIGQTGGQRSTRRTEWSCYSSPCKSRNVTTYYTRSRNFTFRKGLINGEGAWCWIFRTSHKVNCTANSSKEVTKYELNLFRIEIVSCDPRGNERAFN